MAVKKTTPKKAEPKAAPKKASVKKGATKTKTPKKTAAPKAAATKTPKKAAAPKAAMKKAPVKLTDKQTEFLKTIQSHGETGYPLTKKAEAKSVEALKEKKLVKKGAKNKDTGAIHYHATKAGEKHLTGGSTGTTPPSAP